MTPPGARRALLGLVGAIAAAIALVTAVGRIAGFTEVRAALDSADPQWLVLCAVGQVIVFVGYAGVVRRAVLDDQGTLSTGDSLRIVLATFAATQLFALGGAVGLALLYWVIRQRGRERRDAAVTLIGLNTAVYLVFATLAWIAAAIALAAGSAPTGMCAFWLVSVPVLLVAAAWFTAPRRVARWTSSSSGRVRSLLAVGVDAAAWTRHRLRADRELFGWALLYWVGDLVSLGAALRAFDVGIGRAPLVVAYTTGYLAQALPIPLIGTAGVDAATTATLHAVGVPLEAALLGVLAHRLFAFWLPVIPGTVLALTLPAAAWSDRPEPSGAGTGSIGSGEGE